MTLGWTTSGSFSRRGFLATPLAALIPSSVHAEHRFQHDHVMGTSLDLVVVGSPTEAAAAHAAIFGEIARLSKVLSTYDRESEITRFNAAGCSGACSRELSQVIEAYETWKQRTSGAIDSRIGGMVEAWKVAERLQQMPQRSIEGHLNVDALGKAYIADRAVGATLRAAPGIRGVLLNIGGDIVVRGDVTRTIHVADPAARADNAPALTKVRVTTGAIATSGSYERGYRINGRYYSHLLDPRTGFPATGAASATVVARDSVTANALATALCILPPDEGMFLVDSTPGAAAIAIAPNGAQIRSARFAAYEQPRTKPIPGPTNWPAGYEVAVTLTLKEIQGMRVHRPYVAVWAEDPATGKLIRNITVWANKPRWMPELHSWWSRNGGSQELFSITKPTRAPGRYRIVWDGLNEEGHPVPSGSYRIIVETNREHGDYAKETGLLDCGAKAAKIALKETGEFAEIDVEYGPHTAQAS